MPKSTVHLLRHGEVQNPDRILYGRIPGFGLSELGFAMADRAGEYFGQRQVDGAKLVRLVASPLLRAQQTAEPTAQALQLPILTDERVIEADNRFEGLSRVARRLSEPKYWSYVINPFRPSWGEPYREQVARMREAMAEHRKAALEEAGDGAEVIIVGHQLPIWVTRRASQQQPLWHDPRRRECTLTSVTSFEFSGDQLVGLSYHEPNADLLAGAANIPGA